MRMWIAFVAVSWLATATVQAGDIFVNNTAGDDRLPGNLPNSYPGGGPVRTIQRALELALPGDRIVIANTGEPYHEAVSLSDANHHGDPLRPLVIEGNGAVLDGSRPVPADGWQHFERDVFRFRPYRTAYQQVFLNGIPLRRRPIAAGDGKFPPLEPLEWAMHDGLIYFRIEPNKLPTDYNLSCAFLPVGITLYHVHHVEIRDLVVQGYQLDGINAHDGVRDSAVLGATLRGNGRSGLAVAGCSRLDLVDSLVGDNGFAQVLVEGLGVARITRSELLDNTAPPVVEQGGRAIVQP